MAEETCVLGATYGMNSRSSYNEYNLLYDRIADMTGPGLGQLRILKIHVGEVSLVHQSS